MTVAGSILTRFPGPNIQEVFADVPPPWDNVTTNPNPQDNIALPPNLGNGLWSHADRQAPYDRWMMRVKTHWCEGVAQLPVATAATGSSPCGNNCIGTVPNPGGLSDRPSAYIVRLSAPYGFLTVYWLAQRKGQKPVVPWPLAPVGNCNMVLADADIDTGPPDLTEDSTTVYEYTGTYLFLLKKPVWALDGLPAGNTPYATLTPQQNFVPGGNFQNFLGGPVRNIAVA